MIFAPDMKNEEEVDLIVDAQIASSSSLLAQSLHKVNMHDKYLKPVLAVSLPISKNWQLPIFRCG